MCGVSYDEIFKGLRIGFEKGLITKDEYAHTLREHKVASDEMKSDVRDFWKRKQEGGLVAWDEITDEVRDLWERNRAKRSQGLVMK